MGTREELEAELGGLDARERGLRAQRQDTTYRLEQVLREKHRKAGGWGYA